MLMKNHSVQRAYFLKFSGNGNFRHGEISSRFFVESLLFVRLCVTLKEKQWVYCVKE